MNAKETIKELKRLQEVNWKSYQELDEIEGSIVELSDKIHDLDIELGKLIDALENDSK